MSRFSFEPTSTPVYHRRTLEGVMAVVDRGQRIGVLVETANDFLNGPLDAPTAVGYRIESAGSGVPAPSGRFSTPDLAAAAIVIARRANADVLTIGADGLTGFERAALAFELTPAARSADGSREQQIFDRFHMTSTEYARRLADLFGDDARRAAAFRANLAAADLIATRIERNRARRRRTTQYGAAA
jgi:hypothetical protein